MRCFVLLALCLSSAFAQKVGFGGCPNVPVKENFDLSNYTGVWYEIEKNPTAFEFGVKCSSATYESKDGYVSVVNKAVRESTGEETSIVGRATVPDKSVPAKLKVKFDNLPFVADYWVLDTDYKNYSVVYSCFSVFKLFNAEYIWILSRQKTLEDATKQKLYKILDDNKISRDHLIATKQDC